MEDIVLQSGLLYGRLPEQKKWVPLYLEATASYLHIFEGQLRSAQRKGRQLRKLKFGPSDSVGEESSKEKNTFKFFIQQPHGRYTFKVDSSERRGEWIIQLQRTILNIQHGIRAERAKLAKYRWFWGHIDRADCEKKLHNEGSAGNFVISIDDNGYYVISYLHSSGINHSRIIQDGNLFYFESSVTKFESSPVFAEGSNLLEFLKSYISMRMRAAVNIVPLGGSLHQTINQRNPVAGRVLQPFALTNQIPQFLTPQVGHKPLHGQPGPPKAGSLQQLPTLTPSDPNLAKQMEPQQKLQLARVQSLMTPPVKHKSPLRAVKSDVHRAVSFEQLPSQEYASMLTNKPKGGKPQTGIRQLAPVQPLSREHPLLASTQHKPLHSLKFDVHRTMSLDQLSLYSTEQAKTHVNRPPPLVNATHLLNAKQGQPPWGAPDDQTEH